MTNESKKVKTSEWKVFVSMLIIVWSITAFSILDNISSIIVMIGLSLCFIFKEHFIDNNINTCFLNDIVGFDVHEAYIEKFNYTRWETLLLFTISIIGLRVASIFEYVVFTSSMATIMIIFGLIYNFLPEIREYYMHFNNIKNIQRYEEKELELVDSIYKTRSVFSGLITGTFLFCLSVKQITDPLHSIIVYAFIIGIIYYTYQTSINDNTGGLNTIFNYSSRRPNMCGCTC
ncbi:hypothetical protein M0R01_02505 [bacterium]|nr:hypothetical protein [bacterium]